MKQEYISYQTEFSANIVLLCRFLRKKGYSLTASDEITAITALKHIPFEKEQFFKQALRTTLSKNHFEYENFEDMYTEFWSQFSKAADSKIKDREEKKERPSSTQKQQARFDALKSWLNLTSNDDEKVIASYSDLEVLTKKDFADLSQEEMELIMRVLKKIARKQLHKKSRLKKSSRKHKTLDLKKTIRYNLRRGGDIQHLVYSERKKQKLKLVLLCDVSRSMDLYSRFFIHLIYAFQGAYDTIETFVFSTALHQVTAILQNYQFDSAFAMISDRVPQWSGGTTIGSCLDDFVTDFGYSLLDKKTTVLILSDGWDTGGADKMKQSMKAIHKKSKKIIWLNPLAGNPNFSPDAIGMQNALPYINELASAHNLSSLKRVLKKL